MRFDSYISLLRFLQVVCSMGYIPPLIHIEDLKAALPGRVNYYTVKLYLNYNNTILTIEFIKDDRLHKKLVCKKEKNNGTENI